MINLVIGRPVVNLANTIWVIGSPIECFRGIVEE